MVAMPLTMYDETRRLLLLRSRTIDMSLSGVLLHGSGPIRVGQRVNVEVPRGPSRNPLRLNAEVVRIATPEPTRRQHRVALQFTELNALDETVLASLIADAIEA